MMILFWVPNVQYGFFWKETTNGFDDFQKNVSLDCDPQPSPPDLLYIGCMCIYMYMLGEKTKMSWSQKCLGLKQTFLPIVRFF